MISNYKMSHVTFTLHIKLWIDVNIRNHMEPKAYYCSNETKLNDFNFLNSLIISHNCSSNIHSSLHKVYCPQLKTTTN